MATFLLGAWIAGGIFMSVVSLLDLRAPAIVLSVPHPALEPMVKQIGAENMTLLLRHASAEISRFLLKKWELAELALGVALGACLFLGTQRRIFPLLLCGIMLTMVLFQYGVTA